jgi:hypothetical protein
MPAQKLSVNLLPPSEFELSFWGRFLKWAVTTGRYIIILTELVVIIAFLSRFKLDEELRNVNEKIQTQVNYLESEQPRLQEFLSVQKRIGLVGMAVQKSSSISGVLKYLEQRKPPEITITQQTVARNELTISATTLSETALGKMMLDMSRDRIWRSLDLTQIVSDTSTGIKFTLTAYK